MAEQVRRAAAFTTELTAQSEKEVSEVRSHRPGLHDEPAKTGNVTSPVTNSPFSLAASDSSLPAGTGFFKHAGGFRGAQPRTATRAQEVAAMLDKTLGFYVKATGNDESLFVGTVHEDEAWESSERTRPLENPHGGETTAPRQQRRSVGAVPETTEIGSDAKRGVRKGVQAESAKVLTFRFFQCTRKVSASVGGRSAQCRSGARPKGRSQREAEHGAGGLQLPETSSMGEDMGSASPRAVSYSWKLSRDVRLDVKLLALLSSVETTLCSNSMWSCFRRTRKPLCQ